MILEHVKELKNPVIFDKNEKFLYFPINKNAQTSIARNLLAERCIIWKSHKKEWEDKIRELDNKKFDELYKFTIIRNPFERVRSAYTYLMRVSEDFQKRFSDISFDEFVLNHLYDIKTDSFADPHFEFQHPKLYNEGQLFPDFVARFENLTTDWKEIASKIECSDELPHKNKKKKKRNFGFFKKEVKKKDFFTNMTTIKRIETIYKLDFDLLNYPRLS